MGRIQVKGGTPVGAAPLCRTCSHAHIMSGHRESEMMVVCTATYPGFPVPFVVRECSGDNDRNRPNRDQMEKLAIKIAHPVKLAGPIGFGAASRRLNLNLNR
ncbi:MAG TPA: hypothetical protein VHX60_10440 [Acidobacteriaceae bacterium]|jgi:hypothetical protein|nr:hypothetical protein [Acidobacteriaceae bacterium]